MTEYWVCMASKWAVPPVTCHERGTGYTKAEKHTKATGHPTMQTLHEELADRLAEGTL